MQIASPWQHYMGRGDGPLPGSPLSSSLETLQRKCKNSQNQSCICTCVVCLFLTCTVHACRKVERFLIKNLHCLMCFCMVSRRSYQSQAILKTESNSSYQTTLFYFLPSWVSFGVFTFHFQCLKAVVVSFRIPEIITLKMWSSLDLTAILPKYAWEERVPMWSWACDSLHEDHKSQYCTGRRNGHKEFTWNNQMSEICPIC